MNREFEILNRKLNIIYEEIMEMKEVFKLEKSFKEIKELECEAENIEEKIKRSKEEQRWQMENISERKKWFENVEKIFPKEEVAVEMLER